MHWCHSCRSPVYNRGCALCNERFCKACFIRHLPCRSPS